MNGLLIKNVVIVSPERDVPSEATNVLVREGQIVAIGREIAQIAHDSDQVIDGAGHYLTPGLIDAHTHLSDIPGMTFEHETAYPNLARNARRQAYWRGKLVRARRRQLGKPGERPGLHRRTVGHPSRRTGRSGRIQGL